MTNVAIFIDFPFLNDASPVTFSKLKIVIRVSIVLIIKAVGLSNNVCIIDNHPFFSITRDFDRFYRH
jgi:hypothetical protein